MCSRYHRYGRPALCASALLLAACASPVPVGPTPDAAAAADAVAAAEVAFVTNRQLETRSDGRDYYGGDRGPVTAGRCRVAIRDAEDHDGRLLGVAPAATGDVKSAVGKVGRAGVVVYIHGFNEDFGRSCRHAALLQKRLGLDGRLLLFSWPADRKYVTYASDAGDLAWSLPDLRAVLEGLAARHGSAGVSILGHSLGARATVEVLSRMDDGVGAFGQVVLVAPDIARSRFAELRPVLERRAERVTIYASENDLALRLSTVVNTSARLGITDEEAHAGGALSAKVQLVDVSGTGLHSLSGHVYHLRNPAVIEDIGRLFAPVAADAGGSYERVPGSAPGLWRLLPVKRGTTASAGGNRPRNF
ncbi:MAG TPA: alpha/beta hydrolase [Woeseiaceae bacterium]|nr:alpha/beta hydrolase [Woeseiaceae bacterium]